MSKTSCDGCFFYVANGPAAQDGVCTKAPPTYDPVFRLTRYTPVPGNWMACGAFMARSREQPQSLLESLRQQNREASE
jgi:hypothetical protein